MSKLEIEDLSPYDVKPHPRNARTHSRKQRRQLAATIRRVGFNSPVVIDEDNRILAGHGRIEAAKLLGMETVPCVRIGTMSEADKRAYMVADNQLALNAGWDWELLGEELTFQSDLDPEFDPDTLGFSPAEVQKLYDDLNPEEPGDPADDQLPPDQEIEPRCRPGDLWQLGRHRLICGDARDSACTAALMAGEKARLTFNDPPWNLRIQGHVSGLGRTRHREFAFASGEMSTAEYVAFLKASIEQLARHSLDGSIHYLCIDWRHYCDLVEAASSIFTELKNLIVWVKDNGGMGTFYRSRHELILVFKLGSAPHINTFELGQHGRYRTNVWQYKGVNSFKAGRAEELALHPTVKPVQMIADAIKDVSNRGDIVLDLFGGSGSTLIAAHKTARRGYLCEIDPIYCDRIIARWEAYAKDEAERIERTSETMEVTR